MAFERVDKFDAENPMFLSASLTPRQRHIGNSGISIYSIYVTKNHSYGGVSINRRNEVRSI